jgi:hypothetical protein
MCWWMAPVLPCPDPGCWQAVPDHRGWQRQLLPQRKMGCTRYKKLLSSTVQYSVASASQAS